LHPGNGGNPGFSKYDLDSNMRLVFYPAILAWTLLGFWIANLRIRLKKISQLTTENE
jgi:heme exporter protein C